MADAGVRLVHDPVQYRIGSQLSGWYTPIEGVTPRSEQGTARNLLREVPRSREGPSRKPRSLRQLVLRRERSTPHSDLRCIRAAVTARFLEVPFERQSTTGAQ
jgi:hypothetical protein